MYTRYGTITTDSDNIVLPSRIFTRVLRRAHIVQGRYEYNQKRLRTYRNPSTHNTQITSITYPLTTSQVPCSPTIVRTQCQDATYQTHAMDKQHTNTEFIGRTHISKVCTRIRLLLVFQFCSTIFTPLPLVSTLKRQVSPPPKGRDQSHKP